MKYFLSALALGLTLVTVGCTPVEQNARNAAAALQGSLVAAQAQYGATCKANPTQAVCQLVNRAVSGQNALITASETYCGWSAVAPPQDQTTPCVPVKSAEAALIVATANATELVLEIKGVVK